MPKRSNPRPSHPEPVEGSKGRRVNLIEISCLQENLAKALRLIGKAVPSRSSLPVLACVLLRPLSLSKGGEGRIALSATNLELSLTAYLGAKIISSPSRPELVEGRMGEGRGGTLSLPKGIALPYKTFNDVIAAMPRDAVTIRIDPKTVTAELRCGSFVNLIKGIDPQEFPVIPELALSTSSTLSLSKGELSKGVEGLSKALDRVLIAAARDDSRPHLYSVLFKNEGKGSLTLAATDGFRLGRAIVETSSAIAPFSFILPVPAAERLGELLNLGDETISMQILNGGKTVGFAAGAAQLVAQLFEGNYPNYEEIIPKTIKTTVTADSAALLRAVRAAEIFARESNHIITLKIPAAEPVEAAEGSGLIALHAVSAETGSHDSTVDAVVTGQPLTIAFNAQYLAQAIGAMSERLCLELGAPTSPAILRPVGESSYLHVLMPMKVG